MANNNPPIKSEMTDTPSNLTSSASIEPLDLEEKILDLCGACPEGISDAELQIKIPPSIDAQQRATAINRLLAKSKLDLLKSGQMILYKIKISADTAKFVGASSEETLVYRVIEESKTKGIWIRDIRNATNLPQAMLNKVLKILESKKLVKSVKAVGAARKKMFMLFELEPDTEITGGAFYADQEFDLQFVDLLNQQCVKYLRSKAQLALEKHKDFALQRKFSATPSTEMLKHINELKISKIELSLGDVEKVLDTVVYDGLAEKELCVNSACCYTARPVGGARAMSNGFTKVPCAFCPVIGDCRPKGIISPASCVYFRDWIAE